MQSRAHRNDPVESLIGHPRAVTKAMVPLVDLLVYIVIFAIVGYGLYWVCVKFGLPQPVLWICGAILLIIILMFLANQLGVGGSGLALPHMR